MDDTELVFERTCNYWIDAGIVGFYDSLNKPVSLPDSTGVWSQTIIKYSGIEATLYPDKLIVKGNEKQIDLALSYALEKVRTTLYDVSSEDQIASPEKDGRIKRKSTIAGIVVSSTRQASGNTYFREEINENIGQGNIFLPLKIKKRTTSNCIFCGQLINSELFLHKANEVFIGETLKSSPFVEGRDSNRCFHSSHKVSEKCWKCGYVTFFAPLLLFYRKITLSGGKGDTYYALPYVPGNLQATYKLYRNLSGKRGLARVLGADHKNMNYESFFPSFPKGISSFSLSFYFDLSERLLPKNIGGLLQSSKTVGLIDEFGSMFQTALFLKRDSSSQKSFIINETTIDKSAYFIKLFAYLKKEFELTKGGDLLSGMRSFIGKADSKSNYLQKTSALKASHAMTEGKHVYRFLLPLLSSNLKNDSADSYSTFQLTILFQKYDQWLFFRENIAMANIVEQAKNSGWFLSQDFWANKDWDEGEKENLLKRYYYRIERSPSPIGFLEQVRHAYKKIDKEIPKEMVFHKEDGTEDIQIFEVYRVYFLAGMLNGLISGTKKNAISQAGESDKEAATNEN